MKSQAFVLVLVLVLAGSANASDLKCDTRMEEWQKTLTPDGTTIKQYWMARITAAATAEGTAEAVMAMMINIVNTGMGSQTFPGAPAYVGGNATVCTTNGIVLASAIAAGDTGCATPTCQGAASALLAPSNGCKVQNTTLFTPWTAWVQCAKAGLELTMEIGAGTSTSPKAQAAVAVLTTSGMGGVGCGLTNTTTFTPYTTVSQASLAKYALNQTYTDAAALAKLAKYSVGDFAMKFGAEALFDVFVETGYAKAIYTKEGEDNAACTKFDVGDKAGMFSAMTCPATLKIGTSKPGIAMAAALGLPKASIFTTDNVGTVMSLCVVSECQSPDDRPTCSVPLATGETACTTTNAAHLAVAYTPTGCCLAPNQDVECPMPSLIIGLIVLGVIVFLAIGGFLVVKICLKKKN